MKPIYIWDENKHIVQQYAEDTFTFKTLFKNGYKFDVSFKIFPKSFKRSNDHLFKKADILIRAKIVELGEPKVFPVFKRQRVQ